MKIEEKNNIIDSLADQINENKHFYLTDISNLDAVQTSKLRRKCFENNIELIMVKNTLLSKAMDRFEGQFDDLKQVLKNSTSIMFCDTANAPAKMIKELRKELEKPLLKAAFVEESVYIGDEQLDTLSKLKSKEELIGDVLLALQSPMQQLLSALNSGGQQLAGALKTLSEKEN